MDSTFDVAIIGAGLSGIALARFYLDTHPHSKVVIIEKENEIGGTWGKGRVFDTFWTQSPSRTTAFADTPLVLPEDATKIYDTFAAKYVTKYVDDYVKSHVYSGKSLLDRVRLGTEVIGIQKNQDGWTLDLKDSKSSFELRCLRLAIASGLTSRPKMPQFPVDSQWTAPILHHRDFGIQSETMLQPKSSYENFTIIGGGKSAADMVYACGKAKKKVNWIIRKSGDGAGYFLHSKPMGRYRNAAEASLTVNATKFNPSAFRAMLPEPLGMHQSVEGRAALTNQFSAMDQRFKAWANYHGREGALENFSQLDPSYSLFWSRGPPGMMQHDDFFNLVSQNVNVQRADIVGTDKNSILLDNGERAPTDVVFAGTGWDSSYSFLTAQQICDFGLPHNSKDGKAEEEEIWQTALDDADHRILKQFPMLAEPPIGLKSRPVTNKTPARLYQGITPLSEPTLVFLGRTKVPNGFFNAEAQAIWTTAYWDGHVCLPSYEKSREKIAYVTAVSRRRYPSDEGDGLNFFRDMIWYIDGLLSEAGLSSHRKLWWNDPDEPHVIEDLKDCKNEYLTKYESQSA